MSNEHEGLVPPHAQIDGAKDPDRDDVTNTFRRTPDWTNDEIPKEVIGDPAQEVIQEEKGLNPEQIEEYVDLNIKLIIILNNGNLECPTDIINDLLDLNHSLELGTNQIGSNLDNINQMCSRIADSLEKMGKKDWADILRSLQSNLSNQYEELQSMVREVVTNPPDSPTLRNMMSRMTENLRILVRYNRTKIYGQVPVESEQEREERRSEEISSQALQARGQINDVIALCDENIKSHRDIKNIIINLRQNVYCSDVYDIITSLTRHPELDYLAVRILESLDDFTLKLTNLEYQSNKSAEMVRQLKDKYTEIDKKGILYLRVYLDEYADLVRRTRKSST